MAWILPARAVGGYVTPLPPPVVPPPQPPPVDPGVPLVSTPWLPWDMPTQATLDTAPDRVVAPHSMSNYVRSIQDKNLGDAADVGADKTAYEWRYFLPAGGVENPNAVPPAVPTDHRSYGGYWRMRPLGRPTVGAGFSLVDKRWAIQQMKAAGIGHLIIDILGSGTFNNVIEWGQAALAEGWRGRLIPMLDCGGSIVRNGPANASGFLKQLWTGPHAAAWRKHSDGRWFAAAYAPETAISSTKTAFTDAQLTTWWQTWNTTNINGGTAAVLCCCFQRAWRDPTEHTATVFGADALAGFVVVFGRWGVRSTKATLASNIDAAGAPTYSRTVAPTGYGMPYLYTMAFQDARPDQSVFAEAGGFDNFLASWSVIDSERPELVQVATWDDSRETTNIQPTQACGYVPLDLLSRRVVKYRLGIDLPIKRDGLYLAHRRHNPPSIAPQPTYTADTTVYTKRQTNAGFDTVTPQENAVSVLVYATAPGEVQVTIGGVAMPLVLGSQTGTTVTVPAGESKVKTTGLLRSGVVVATLRRGGVVPVGGQVTSKVPINLTSQLVQDLTYYMTSSLR